jgi:hypothetical protein
VSREIFLMLPADWYLKFVMFSVCFFLAQQPNVDQGRLMLEVSRSHKITYHRRQDFSGRRLGPSRRPVPNNTQHSQETDIHAPSGIPTRNPSKRKAIDPRLRPLDHWDRHYLRYRWFMHLIFLESLKTFDPCWLQTSIMLSACNSHAPQPHVCF